MNVNKILVSGFLIVCFITEAEALGNGGFYVGVNAGIGLTQSKYRNSVDEQKDVLDKAKMPEALYLKDFGSPKDGYYYSYDKVIAATSTVSGNNLKKNKTKFLAEVSVGWDHRKSNIIFGIDFNFGMKFGKSKKISKGLSLSNSYATKDMIESHRITKYTVEVNNFASTVNGGSPLNSVAGWLALGHGEYVLTAYDDESRKGVDSLKLYNSTAKYTVKVKNQWTISFMPRVGYLITPKCELFVTAGMMITKNKFTLNNDEENLVTKKKAKVVPVLGGGVRYEFNEHLFTKLEYNYEFKAKMSKTLNGVTHKIKNSSHTIKLGIGYRF